MARHKHGPHRYSRVALAATMLCLAAGASNVFGQPAQLAKLVAGDGAAGDRFGAAVALDGPWALVGAPMDDDGGADSGAAYMFRRAGASWVQEAKLLPVDGSAGDNFGFSVAIDGDVALVGAPLDDAGALDSGSVYVFRWDGLSWVQEAKLVSSDPNDEERFGVAVAIQGDSAVIGANRDDELDYRAGAVFIFHYDGAAWQQDAKLLPDTGGDTAVYGYFGCSVAIDGPTIAVGADGQYVQGQRQGAAYVFRWNGSTWFQEARLAAPDAAYLDDFGEAVGIHGDVVAVGSFWDDDKGTDSGSAYVFRYGLAGWTFEDKLLAADGAAGDEFGRTLAMAGDSVVGGAHYHDGAGADSGAAYIFSFDGAAWTQGAELTPDDGMAGDEFGFSVAADGENILVGAGLDDEGGIDSGSAYLFGPGSPVAATVDVKPEVLNPDSHGVWVTCYIELPGGYDPADIDVASVRLNVTVAAAPWPYEVGDYDEDGVPDLMVKFNRQQVVSVLPPGGTVEVLITGMVGAELFSGTDTITVLPRPPVAFIQMQSCW